MKLSQVEHFFLNDTNCNSKWQLNLAFGFTVFTIIALGIDSVFFTQQYFDARIITNIAAILYFFFLFFSAEVYLRKLMFVMVFLSYIGELIFCKLLGMYEYRTEFIPLYVPFGHAIVYASGYIFANTKWAIQKEATLRKLFAISFILIFAAVGFFLEDTFTLIFGALFFVLMKRKRWQNLYYFIALCVIFIELVGTYFGCWVWVSNTFGVIPTINPPIGAVFFYAGGDILLVKIISVWENFTFKKNV